MINKFEGRYSFLSNFYPSEIEHQGIKYPTVEHYYVAMKADSSQIINGMHYSLDDFREMISKISTPGQVKRLGRKIQLRKNWNSYKLEVMNWVVRDKFKQEDLKELLISTGDEELIEGNTWNDTFWGVCNGKGKNHLGKILMEVRNEIRGIKRTGLEEILK